MVSGPGSQPGCLLLRSSVDACGGISDFILAFLVSWTFLSSVKETSLDSVCFKFVGTP